MRYRIYTDDGGDEPLTPALGKYWYGKDWEEILDALPEDAFGMVADVFANERFEIYRD